MGRTELSFRRPFSALKDWEEKKKKREGKGKETEEYFPVFLAAASGSSLFFSALRQAHGKDSTYTHTHTHTHVCVFFTVTPFLLLLASILSQFATVAVRRGCRFRYYRLFGLSDSTPSPKQQQQQQKKGTQIRLPLYTAKKNTTSPQNKQNRELTGDEHALREKKEEEFSSVVLLHCVSFFRIV